MQEKDVINGESTTSEQEPHAEPGFGGWLKLGAIATATAVAGGLAAAWYYRKTLNRLVEAEPGGADSASGMPDTETEYED